MSTARIVSVIVAGIVVAFIAFVVALFVVKALWAWTIPDLLPGAVEQGLVAGSISWLTAIKIAIFIAVFSAFAGGHQAGCSQKPR